MFTDLVGVVRSGGSGLALVTRSELGEVTVVVTLPVIALSVNCANVDVAKRIIDKSKTYILW